MTVERTRFTDTFGGNQNVVTLVAKVTATKPNRSRHLYNQNLNRFRIESETGLYKWVTAIVSRFCRTHDLHRHKRLPVSYAWFSAFRVRCRTVSVKTVSVQAVYAVAAGACAR